MQIQWDLELALALSPALAELCVIDGILQTRQVAAISLPLPANQPAISAIKGNSLLKEPVSHLRKGDNAHWKY